MDCAFGVIFVEVVLLHPFHSDVLICSRRSSQALGFCHTISDSHTDPEVDMRGSVVKWVTGLQVQAWPQLPHVENGGNDGTYWRRAVVGVMEGC